VSDEVIQERDTAAAAHPRCRRLIIATPPYFTISAP
jgi:hypothetical protein